MLKSKSSSYQNEFAFLQFHFNQFSINSGWKIHIIITYKFCIQIAEFHTESAKLNIDVIAHMPLISPRDMISILK